ncbi:acyl-CoA hydrolase [Pontibacillus halophilus JSM 076056 = DSM 19796]|uniref:Acyl-CoA hydrolase n=1 Tax=Pontibacillus halophilus JSM 076056 = DSM 19796 TaxID=1385510 RepID=A0A0A5GRJ2_9BACI|nr:acyl-CoA thioesterase [Pontibacillus halophilus]KGX93790.1 acyl-CoA hydrolase [Pontibacillus halophilus JSM 076056 = DSM 19796]
MEDKRCVDSLVIKNSHVLPSDTNNHGTLFGGRLMAYMDDVAAIAATRHARRNVVTASTDSVDFLHPIYQGHAICLEAFVTYTRTTSMEVFVKAITEDLLTGERHICATAFLTMVAVDENSKPVSVPCVKPETEEEIWLHEGAPRRAQQRKERRDESKEFSKRFGTEFPWHRKG